jgi:hypothetical protein
VDDIKEGNIGQSLLLLYLGQGLFFVHSRRLLLFLKSSENILELLDYLLALLFCQIFVHSQTKRYRGNGFLLSFKFSQSFLVLLFNFRVTNDVEKYLNNVIVLWILYLLDITQRICHFRDLNV